MLDVCGVTKDFGGFRALDGVDVSVERGQIHAVIGPNGAGKTTLFNLISGSFPATSGEILFEGKRLARLKPHERTRLGMARTFQNIRLIKTLTVLENVMLGCHSWTRAGFLRTLASSPFRRSPEESWIRDTAQRYLDFVGLGHRAEMWPHNLPYGEQRRLEIARALAVEGSLVLLDEPAAGMNPQETQELNLLIRRLVDVGKTILLIEHDMKMVMNIADRITVISYGRKIAQGTPAQVRADRAVIEAYLGEEE